MGNPEYKATLSRGVLKQGQGYRAVTSRVSGIQYEGNSPAWIMSVGLIQKKGVTSQKGEKWDSTGDI